VGSEVVSMHDMKAYDGLKIGDPLIRTLDIGLRIVVSWASWPLNPRGKSPLCPLSRRLGGPHT